MLIDLEQKCAATHRWELVARFEYCALAIQAAIALSALDGSTYRVTDKRWPEDPASPWTTVFTGGEVAA
jgi:hypothetical protein